MKALLLRALQSTRKETLTKKSRVVNIEQYVDAQGFLIDDPQVVVIEPINSLPHTIDENRTYIVGLMRCSIH